MRDTGKTRGRQIERRGRRKTNPGAPFEQTVCQMSSELQTGVVYIRVLHGVHTTVMSQTICNTTPTVWLHIAQIVLVNFAPAASGNLAF